MCAPKLNFPCAPVNRSRWEDFKSNMQMRISHYRFRYLVWSGYCAEDGEPLRCECCSYWEFDDKVIDRMDWTLLEFERRCSKCNTVCGYWAYGYWEPRF